MKKIKRSLSCLMLLLFVSCGEKTNQLINNGKHYTVNISESDKIVSVMVMPNIVDSLNTSEDKIVEMAQYMVKNADNNVVNKLTYELPTSALLSVIDNSFVGMISGKAENSYGVKSMVSNSFYFNIKNYELTNTLTY